ncbi:hypothetical protein [Nocardioides sp. URHA0032]|uniref:hypothetical protein n=1 Tax=Nocardioides sp. URHA0032 TaxID=1380388 RepID=UPI00048F5261|nr:hypothetical protein [Nocardioides sp. URHA0032]
MTLTQEGPDAPQLTTHTLLTVRQICDITGRDRKTINTWINATPSRYPNAVQETGGRKGWTVPVQDLVDAGDLDPAQVVEVAATLEALRETRQVAELRDRVVVLEAELATTAALASEREKNVEFLQQLLTRALPAGGAR